MLNPVRLPVLLLPTQAVVTRPDDSADQCTIVARFDPATDDRDIHIEGVHR